MGEDSRSRLCTSPLPERGEVSTNCEPSPGIQLLRVSTFDHLWASEQVVEAFTIWLGECRGLLGALLEGITEGERNPRMLNAWAWAAVVVAEEEWHSGGGWMTATGSPRHEGRIRTMWVVYCDEPCDPANPGPLSISTLLKYNEDKANENRNRWWGSQPSTISRFAVSSWDTRTISTYAAKICQLTHRT